MTKKKPKPKQEQGPSFTAAQQQVIDHSRGPLLAGAVAGAGKSTTLVERVARLVGSGTSLDKILLVAFNVDAAEDLNRKLKARLKLRGEKVEVARTLHGLAYAVWRSSDASRGFMLDKGGSLYTRAIRQGSRQIGMDVVEADLVARFASRVKNDCLVDSYTLGLRALGQTPSNLVDIATDIVKRKKASAMRPDMLLDAFFAAENTRTNGTELPDHSVARFVTFDDLLSEAVRLLTEDDQVRQLWQQRYEYVIVDESQDLCEAQWRIVNAVAESHQNLVVVGDVAQCVAVGTLISTTNGPRPIEEMAEGDRLVAFRNGKNQEQRVSAVWRTGERECITITTESGRKLTMSLDHRIWASTPDLRAQGGKMVYLMYRPGFGFRVGITNRGLDTKNNRWGNRLSQEGGERLWVIAHADTKEEALRLETSFSLRFGVPTLVFNAKDRGLNQNRVDAVFREFGNNGFRLLEAAGMRFDYPHWTSGPTANGSVRRRVVRIVAHSAKGTQVFMEWTGGPEIDVTELPKARVHRARRGGSRIRSSFASLQDAEAFATELAKRSGAIISCTLSDSGPRRNLMLYTAGSLHPGMLVPVRSGDGFVTEQILATERCRAVCYDLSVDDAATFYGNGILSHNCVYRWRGAKPEYLLKFTDNWKNAKSVFMDVNFRSGSEIISAANAVLDRIPADQKLPMRLHPARTIAGFVGFRETESPHTEARDIADNIRKHIVARGEWKDHAILVRRNDQTALLEVALLKANIPARVVRGQSFFATREAKAAIAYLRLIVGCATEADFDVAIMNPPKYLGRVYIDTITKAKTPEVDWIDVMDASPATADRRYNANARDFMAKIRELRLVHQKGATPLQLFSKVCEKMSWDRWVDGDSKEESPDNDAKMNFDRIRDFLADFDTTESLFATIEKLKASQRSAAASRNAVAIVTAHSAKGLEWPIVYIAGVVDRTWPVGWDDLVDERRVFYVAVTRARDELWLNGYQFKDSDTIDVATRSPFIADLELQPTDRSGHQILAAGQMALLSS